MCIINVVIIIGFFLFRSSIRESDFYEAMTIGCCAVCPIFLYLAYGE